MQRVGVISHVFRRRENLRVEALDSDWIRHTLASIGIRQVGDNIVGSSLSNRITNRSTGNSGDAEVGGSGVGSDRAGDEATGFGDLADVPGSSACVCFFGRFAL